MVQLNPFKWGSKRRKKSQDKLRIGEIKESLKKNTRSQGIHGQKRRKLKKELASLGGKTDKQAAREDRQSRRKYDKEHKIVNRRGRTTGYKEGYDPKKGVQKKTTTSKPKSSTAPKKKMSSIERENRKRFGDAHVDKLIARQKAFRNRNKK
jgi:hypothetical protein